MFLDRDVLLRAEAALNAAEYQLTAIIKWGDLPYATDREFTASALDEVKAARANLRAALWPHATAPVLQYVEK